MGRGPKAAAVCRGLARPPARARGPALAPPSGAANGTPPPAAPRPADGELVSRRHGALNSHPIYPTCSIVLRSGALLVPWREEEVVRAPAAVILNSSVEVTPEFWAPPPTCPYLRGSAPANMRHPQAPATMVPLRWALLASSACLVFAQPSTEPPQNATTPNSTTMPLRTCNGQAEPDVCLTYNAVFCEFPGETPIDGKLQTVAAACPVSCHAAAVCRIGSFLGGGRRWCTHTIHE